MEELNVAVDAMLENGMGAIEIIGLLEIAKNQLIADLLAAEDGED